MRILLAIVVVAGLGWGGWWYVNAATRESAVDTWLEERRAAGWIAEARDVRVQGFPNRVDLVVEDLSLADPGAGWSWSAPEFQVLSLTWKPHHVIAVWPGAQTFSTPYDTVEIAADRLRGSVVFEPRPGFALDRSTIEIEAMTIDGEAGWQATLGSAVLATRQTGESGDGLRFHDVSFVAETLALPAPWTVGLDRSGLLPPAMEEASLDATLAFDRRWDQRAIEGENPRLQGVDVRDLRVRWGRLDLRARGELATDAEGYAQGSLNLRVRNWQEMLAIATASGMVGSSTARGIETALGLLARFSSDRNSIDVPLVFEGGRARIGPVPVADAPRLAGRLP